MYDMYLQQPGIIIGPEMPKIDPTDCGWYYVGQLSEFRHSKYDRTLGYDQLEVNCREYGEANSKIK